MLRGRKLRAGRDADAHPLQVGADRKVHEHLPYAAPREVRARLVPRRRLARRLVGDAAKPSVLDEAPSVRAAGVDVDAVHPLARNVRILVRLLLALPADADLRGVRLEEEVVPRRVAPHCAHALRNLLRERGGDASERRLRVGTDLRLHRQLRSVHPDHSVRGRHRGVRGNARIELRHVGDRAERGSRNGRDKTGLDKFHGVIIPNSARRYIPPPKSNSPCTTRPRGASAADSGRGASAAPRLAKSRLLSRRRRSFQPGSLASISA